MNVAVDGELTNVDPVLFQAWHPVARSDEVGPAPTQVMLVGRLWTLRRVSGRVVADPRAHAVCERWGLIWLAPGAPVAELFDDPDEADTRDAGGWLVPLRTPAPAGTIADRFLGFAGTGNGYQVSPEPYGFRGVQVGLRHRVTYVYRAPFQLLLRQEEPDTGAIRTLLCFVQPEHRTSSRIFGKLLLRRVPRPGPAALARELATEQTILAEGLTDRRPLGACDGLTSALRRVLNGLGDSPLGDPSLDNSPLGDPS